MTTWQEAYERLCPGIPIEELDEVERGKIAAFLLTSDQLLKEEFAEQIRAAIKRDELFYAQFLIAHSPCVQAKAHHWVTGPQGTSWCDRCGKPMRVPERWEFHMKGGYKRRRNTHHAQAKRQLRNARKRQK